MKSPNLKVGEKYIFDMDIRHCAVNKSKNLDYYVYTLIKHDPFTGKYDFKLKSGYVLHLFLSELISTRKTYSLNKVVEIE